MPAERPQGISVHPILESVLRTDQPLPKTLCGYVGPATREGQVTVYPNLTNLQKSYEISTDDILGVADVPESMRPFGAQVIWLRGDAIVGFRNVETGESGSSASSNAPSQAPAGMAEVRSGRLLMEVPIMAADAGAHCTCSQCSVCMSHCDSSCVSGGDCMYPPRFVEELG